LFRLPEGEGFLYNVLIYARGRYKHDFKLLLENTRRLHKHVVHLCLGGDQKAFRLTIPAVLGTDLVSKITTAFYDAALSTLRPGLDMLADERVQQLADAQPEYVLGPSHPMTFLTPEMPCTIFGA
jgi:hypothetical protein